MTMRNEYIGSPRKRSYALRWILLLGGTIVALFLILAFPLGMFMVSGGFPAQPAPVVSTIIVQPQPWQSRLEVVGTLSPSEGADLAFEVAGVVEEVYFESGGEVQRGAPLVRLRATDETARLRTLEANANLAAATHARNQRLLDIQGISTAEIEQSEAALAAAQAQVAEQRAVIEKKLVRAPFSGHLGIRRVNVGQYVNPGTPVTTLQVLDPIHFDFYVPQQNLDRLSVGQKIAIRVDSYPNELFEGEIATIDPKVDTATRNIAVRAILNNTEGKLLSGMYATAIIDTGGEMSYLTVPQTAVTFNPFGNTVYVVEEVTEDGETHLVANQTFVMTGDTRGDQIAILSGVTAGTQIVSAGQFKLQNGATIEINNDVQPANDPDPRPIQR
jgi:membrane fusion protein (multidrug efflux system)